MRHMVDNIKYYFKILNSIFVSSFKREMYFKSNFIIRIATDLVWYGLNLAFFQVIYMNSNGLGGWNINEVNFFMGNVFLIDSINMAFLYPNVQNIPYIIRMGDLDNVLLKPINSRFYISVRRINVSSLLNMFFGIGLIIFFGQKMNMSYNIGKLAVYLLLVVNGVLIMYSILFMAATLSIYVNKSEGLITTLFDIFNLGMKPDSIYGGIFKTIITYVVPLLIIVNFPVKYMTQKLADYNVLWSIIVTVLLLLVSDIFWKIS